MNSLFVKILDDMKEPNGDNSILRKAIDVHVQTRICVECGKETNPAKYKKQIDKDEFYISGVCKKCQKLYFPPEPKE